MTEIDEINQFLDLLADNLNSTFTDPEALQRAENVQHKVSYLSPASLRRRYSI